MWRGVIRWRTAGVAVIGFYWMMALAGCRWYINGVMIYSLAGYGLWWNVGGLGVLRFIVLWLDFMVC